MGIIERRERLKKQVGQDIIKIACEIAKNEGWQAVSIRRIADMIEYSPPTLYEHFASKDNLMEVIRSGGFATLKHEYDRIKNLYRDPEKQLVEVAQSIWNFSIEQPEVFQLMFNLEGAYCQSKQIYGQEMDSSGNTVWEMIASLRPKSADMISKTYYEWWCLTFGFIAMTVITQPRHTVIKAEPIYLDGVRRFIRSIM